MHDGSNSNVARIVTVGLAVVFLLVTAAEQLTKLASGDASLLRWMLLIGSAIGMVWALGVMRRR